MKVKALLAALTLVAFTGFFSTPVAARSTAAATVSGKSGGGHCPIAGCFICADYGPPIGYICYPI